MGSCQCWRCARCGALSRTWRGFLRFAQVGGQWRPTCDNALECKERQKDPPEGEFWLDIEDRDQGQDEPEPDRGAQPEPVFANLLGEDGQAWCFECKPVGMAAVEPSEAPCSRCGE